MKNNTQNKIIFITGSMGKGGAERVISILSKHYDKKGWSVSIIMLLHNKIEYRLPSHVNVVNLSEKNGIKRDFIKVIKNTRNYIAKQKPDVIVAFMAQNILLAHFAIKKMNIPFIVSERIDPAEVKRNIIFKYLLNKIYKTASVVIFQTKRAQSYFNKAIQGNSCVIGNPISISCQKNKTSKHKIVSVGRMTKQKNQKMLISVFKRIHDRHPNYELVIYGEGPLREELHAKIKELNLDNCVSLPGISNNIHEDIADAEIFVLPSNYEGLSNALMEAMLMGLPSISTNCAGSDEIIDNYKNGLLVPIGDENEMFNAIEKLINDKNLRKIISKNAIKSMERYKEENIAEMWDNIINTILLNGVSSEAK